MRSASPASSSLFARISARRSARQRPCLLSHQLLRAARQQDVRRAFGEGEQTLLPLGVAVNRAHQLALGGEGHLRDAGEAGVERFGLQPGLARGDDQRAFGRIALHRPTSVALLQHGVVGAVGSAERTHELEPQGAVDRPASVPADVAFRRIAGAA